MSALDQLREKTSQREAKLERKREKKETKEIELQRVREEVFRATRAIYIKPLASRPPLEFCESSEGSKESNDVK